MFSEYCQYVLKYNLPSGLGSDFLTHLIAGLVLLCTLPLGLLAGIILVSVLLFFFSLAFLGSLFLFVSIKYGYFGELFLEKYFKYDNFGSFWEVLFIPFYVTKNKMCPTVP